MLENPVSPWPELKGRQQLEATAWEHGPGRSCLASAFHRQLPFIICRVIKALSWNKLGFPLFLLASIQFKVLFQQSIPLSLVSSPWSPLHGVLASKALVLRELESLYKGRGEESGISIKPSMVSHHNFSWAEFYCSWAHVCNLFFRGVLGVFPENRCSCVVRVY